MEAIRRMSDPEILQFVQDNPQMYKAMELPANILTMSPQDRDNLIKSRLNRIYKPSAATVAADGTSFASPEVAGVAALLLQANPQATPAQIKHYIVSTAKPMGHFTKNEQGAGFIDVKAALKQALKDAGGGRGCMKSPGEDQDRSGEVPSWGETDRKPNAHPRCVDEGGRSGAYSPRYVSTARTLATHPQASPDGVSQAPCFQSLSLWDTEGPAWARHGPAARECQHPLSEEGEPCGAHI